MSDCMYTETTEGLHSALALAYYSRTRFIVNLLPLLQQASSLRRVVTVFVAGKEGPIDTSDLQGWKIPMRSARGHAGSLVTVSLEAIAKTAPDVTFIHDFPGLVKTGLMRGTTGIAMSVMKAVFTIIAPFTAMSNRECGERQLFLATSARFPANTDGKTASGVPLADGVTIARGTIGESGSGVYSVDQHGESSGPVVEELLAKMRKDGTVEQVWQHTTENFKRITGLEAV